MKVVATALPDVLIVESPVHDDERGYFSEIFHEEKFRSMGLPTHFAQDNHSRSLRGVLRGLHYQLARPQGKLVRPVQGVIFDVAVDLRRASPTFGRWVGETLRAGDGRQLWIPAGFAHGLLVLSEHADVAYKCTAVYDATSDLAVRWNDPRIGIHWPLAEGVATAMSPRDAAAPLLEDAACFE